MARVSICIPAYNHGRYLAQALESALAQTVQDFEVVVSDNASTDNTAQVVAEFARRDERVRYHRSPTTLLMHQNFNQCIELAQAPYIKFLCADDVLEARCVERLLEKLELDPRVRLVACARRTFSDEGRAGAVRRYAASEVRCSGDRAIRACFFRGNLIGEPTAVLFRRDDAGDGFSGRYPQLVDMEMWFRLLEGGAFSYLPETLCGIRLHEHQATLRNIMSGAITEDRERLFADFAGKPYLKGSLAERLLWDFRMAYALAREKAAGRPRRRSNALYYPRIAGPVGAAAAAFWRMTAST